MTSFWRVLAVIAGLSTGPALAQESTDPETGLSLGETIVDGRTIGEEYIKDTFGDWAHRCVTTADGNDPCQGYQLLLDAGDNAVAEFTITPLSADGEAVAGSNIVTPLETLLPRGVMLQIDDGPQRRFGFTFCASAGCVARVGLTQEDVDAMKRGAEATVTVYSVNSPQTPVALTLSLIGFTAAFEGLDPIR